MKFWTTNQQFQVKAKLAIISICLLTSLFMVGTRSAYADTNKQPITLDWIDLVPEIEQKNFDKLGMPLPQHDGTMPKQNLIGNTRPELDGSLVKIPGFVIPLEGDDLVITEFLLVPYFGACIHVPPPPPNQIIYVKLPKGAPIQELWDVVYVVGELKTDVQNHGAVSAQTGYTIIGDHLEPYDDE